MVASPPAVGSQPSIVPVLLPLAALLSELAVRGFVFVRHRNVPEERERRCRRFKGQVHAQHFLIYIDKPSGVQNF